MKTIEEEEEQSKKKNKKLEEVDDIVNWIDDIVNRGNFIQKICTNNYFVILWLFFIKPFDYDLSLISS